MRRSGAPIRVLIGRQHCRWDHGVGMAGMVISDGQRGWIWALYSMRRAELLFYVLTTGDLSQGANCVLARRWCVLKRIAG